MNFDPFLCFLQFKNQGMVPFAFFDVMLLNL